jgi:hypothetical protein
MRPRLVAEMSAQLRKAAIDGFVAGRTTVPEFVDEFVARNQVAVALSESKQDAEDPGLGLLFLVALAQHAFEREYLPLTESETVPEFFFREHYPDVAPKAASRRYYATGQ